ncbi:hypothetical protein B0H14DRAFT_3857709 [Mycena olivaceomarginata]|nr:hypothetical protein B0H14DRAFT_3857709 [Mycena olivaceomarginata]
MSVPAIRLFVLFPTHRCVELNSHVNMPPTWTTPISSEASISNLSRWQFFALQAFAVNHIPSSSPPPPTHPSQFAPSSNHVTYPIQKLVSLKPQSQGFGAELKDEKHATDSLASVVSTVLAGRCNMVKNTILGSLGSDPEEGTTTTALHPGATDESLTSVRAKHPDLVMQSRYVLDLDFQTYGAINLTSFTTPSVLASPSTAPQAAAVATASGNDSNSRFRGLATTVALQSIACATLDVFFTKCAAFKILIRVLSVCRARQSRIRTAYTTPDAAGLAIRPPCLLRRSHMNISTNQPQAIVHRVVSDASGTITSAPLGSVTDDLQSIVPIRDASLPNIVSTNLSLGIISAPAPTLLHTRHHVIRVDWVPYTESAPEPYRAVSSESTNLHSVMPPNDRLDSATSAAPSTSLSTTAHTGNASSLSGVAPTSTPNFPSSALCYLCDKAETSTPTTSTQAPRPISGLIPSYPGVASPPSYSLSPRPANPGAAVTLLLTESPTSPAHLKPHTIFI